MARETFNGRFCYTTFGYTIKIVITTIISPYKQDKLIRYGIHLSFSIRPKGVEQKLWFFTSNLIFMARKLGHKGSKSLLVTKNARSVAVHCVDAAFFSIQKDICVNEFCSQIAFCMKFAALRQRNAPCRISLITLVTLIFYYLIVE